MAGLVKPQFYTWTETAQALQLTDDGLRRFLAYPPDDLILRAVIDCRGDYFRAKPITPRKLLPYYGDPFEGLNIDRPEAEWDTSSPPSFYGRFGGQAVPDGIDGPLIYSLSGVLMVSPMYLLEAARFLPNNDWCTDSPHVTLLGDTWSVDARDIDFPGIEFQIEPPLDPENEFPSLPASMDIREWLFVAEDVDGVIAKAVAAPQAEASMPARITTGGAGANSVPDDCPMTTRERNSLLRIIRALGVMAKLPERGAASSIVAQLHALGCNSPGEATVRKLLSDARQMEID